MWIFHCFPTFYRLWIIRCIRSEILVHSPHLVVHWQLFSVLTQCSSLGAGEMSCSIAMWAGQSPETGGREGTRKHRVTRANGFTDCFEIRSNLSMGLCGLSNQRASIAAAWIPDTTKRGRAGKDQRRSQSFKDKTGLWEVCAIFWRRQTKRKREKSLYAVHQRIRRALYSFTSNRSNLKPWDSRSNWDENKDKMANFKGCKLNEKPKRVML